MSGKDLKRPNLLDNQHGKSKSSTTTPNPGATTSKSGKPSSSGPSSSNSPPPVHSKSSSTPTTQLDTSKGYFTHSANYSTHISEANDTTNEHIIGLSVTSQNAVQTFFDQQDLFENEVEITLDYAKRIAVGIFQPDSDPHWLADIRVSPSLYAQIARLHQTGFPLYLAIANIIRSLWSSKPPAATPKEELWLSKTEHTSIVRTIDFTNALSDFQSRYADKGINIKSKQSPAISFYICDVPGRVISNQLSSLRSLGSEVTEILGKGKKIDVTAVKLNGLKDLYNDCKDSVIDDNRIVCLATNLFVSSLEVSPIEVALPVLESDKAKDTCLDIMKAVMEATVEANGEKPYTSNNKDLTKTQGRLVNMLKMIK